MSILERIEDTGRFGREAVMLTFGPQSDVLKINKKTYQRCVELTHVHSKVSICESILKSHRENPYQTVDELLGDLQIVLAASWNHFRKIDPTKRLLSVEDLIGEGIDTLKYNTTKEGVCVQQ